MSPSPCVKTLPLAWEAFLPQLKACPGQGNGDHAQGATVSQMCSACPGSTRRPCFFHSSCIPSKLGFWHEEAGDVLCNVPGMRTQGTGEGRQEKLVGSQPLLCHFPPENWSRASCEIRKHVVIWRGTRTIPKKGESLLQSRNRLYFPLVLSYLLRCVMLSSPGVGLASRVPTALENGKRQLELFSDLCKGAAWSPFPCTFSLQGQP